MASLDSIGRFALFYFRKFPLSSKSTSSSSRSLCVGLWVNGMNPLGSWTVNLMYEKLIRTQVFCLLIQILASRNLQFGNGMIITMLKSMPLLQAPGDCGGKQGQYLTLSSKWILRLCHVSNFIRLLQVLSRKNGFCIVSFGVYFSSRSFLGHFAMTTI